MQHHTSREEDVLAIEAISQRDMQFALENDANKMMSQFQWGTYQYGMRPRTGGDTVRTSGKLMRILQRQPDGAWKIYRGISTMDPSPQS